jgi:hypothetical protein
MIDNEEPGMPAPPDDAAAGEAELEPGGMLPFAGGATAYSPSAWPRGARQVELGPGLPVSESNSHVGLVR